MAPPTFMGLTGRPLSLAVSTVATTGFVLFGYDQGVMSGIITAPAFNNLFTATKNNSTMQGFVTAIYEIGCLFGAIFILIFGDIIGRRRAMMLGGATMIVGVIIQVTAQPGSTPLAQFIIGRVITGVGNGINTSTIPTYQAECSRTTNRGLLICIEGGVIAFGTLVAYWIDFAASYGPPNLTWRFPIAFQIVFALIVCIGMIWLPESPRWLLTRERYEEGEIVIAALRGLEIDDKETQLQKAIIMDSIKASGYGDSKATPIKAVFTNGKTQHFRRMLLGVSSQFMQQVGGCNAVIYYLPILFQSSIKQTHTMSLLLGGVNMVVYAIFATVSWFIIERAGRRKLFLWGTVGQGLSMVLTFSCLIPGTPGAAKGAAVGLFTYIASFGATWLPLPWLYPAEINPIKTRAKANALIGWGTYLFFAAVNACFIPVIYFFYPETANRSLEEIDIIFAKGYVENISYVKAARDLPFLGDEEVEQKAFEYGLITEITGNVKGSGVRRRVSDDDETLVMERGLEKGGKSGISTP
ncbi:MAG: hypothetical protein MMC33_010773 [Icmadophila ericetorum]|nr:hypothetical protein [Icmadophila ericetorum]